MEREKVLFLITKGNWGGAQRYVFDLACGFKSKNYEVVVGHGEGTALPKKLDEQNIRSFSIKRLGRDINPFADLFVFFELIKVLKHERPDILHINSPKIGGLGALAGRLTGVRKIIYTAHGWYFNEDRNWLSKLATKILSWLTIILSHHTIVIGEKEKRDVINWPLVKKRIVLIHNGIGTIAFTPRDEAKQIIINASKLPSKFLNSFWLGTIGELHKNKGHTYLIKAVKQFKARTPNLPLILIIIGDGEEEGILKKLVKENDLEETVFFTGFITDAPKLLPAFDCFILPSIKEGLPYVLMEAGQAQLPVIASNVGAISDIIENEKNGLLIEAKNVSEVGQKISLLVVDSDLRKVLGENLRQRIFQEFNLEKMIQETEKIYLS